VSIKKTVVVVGLLLSCGLVATASYLIYAYNRSVDLTDRQVSVIINQGDSFNLVADSLIDKQVIDSRRILKLFARYRSIDTKLVPGRYNFTGTNSIKSVLDRLEAGDYLRIRVTIPEGAPIWQVASLLAERMEIDSARTIALSADTPFVTSLGILCLEGYLFPETYFFPWGTTLGDMVTEMVAMFRNQTDPVWMDSLPNGLTREQVIVLASIVEAEARLVAEMPTIASVYHNRLRRRMKLDADPTVIYGLGGLDRPLFSRDLGQDTPYNTYLHKGLPPTAINSPGLAAIKAALNPSETDFLFFVADGTGRHRFSRTNAEHNRARREIKNQSNGQ
jgi:UPF0755 protein